ncbi:MAG: class I SAM-dependent methyltransferase [Bacteroidetes bacterium]|nr:class I SAM-dependent methyltransferase [Bacteroidota bacterium]
MRFRISKSVHMNKLILNPVGQTELSVHHTDIYSYPNYKSLQTLTLAQKSGSWKVTAWAYERLWRKQSVSLLTLGKFHIEDELNLLESAVLSSQNPNPVICDLTCSTGLYGRTLLDKISTATVFFLDYSLQMLLEVNQRNLNKDRSVLVQGFCEDAIFQNSVLDAVVCGGSWNEITRTDETLARMFSALKPGGVVFWMGVLPAKSVVGRFLQFGAASSGGLHFDHSEKIEKAFKFAGFSEIEINSVHPVFTLTARKPK